MIKFYTSLCVLFFIGGCAVGPNYSKHQLENFPQKWVSASQSDKTSQEENWWTYFHDPILTKLIQTAIKQNADLKIAKARVQEARGARLTTISALFPQVDSSLSNRKGNLGENTANQKTRLFEGGFDASWELDIFGGNRRAAEASTYTLRSKEASEKHVLTSLVAEVVRTYLDYRRVEKQITLTQENLKAQEETLTVIKGQEREGVSNLLDVARIETQVNRTAANIPQLEANLVSIRGTLGILIGDMPQQITAKLKPTAIIPDATIQKILLNTPATIIATRPDVQVAEWDLATATANQGVALSNWFPKISLSGLLGFQTSPTFGNIDTWNLAGAIRLPFIDFGRVRGLIRQADARQAAALATYEKTVQSALAEVETTFTAYAKSRDRLLKLRKAAVASRTAERISRIHFQEGLNSLLDVLYAQQNRLEAEITLAQEEAAVGQYLASLCKALGGHISTENQLQPNS